MPLTGRRQADELFQKIRTLYENGNYSEAINLIENERDLLGENLNMGDQQKLSKLYANCAYGEIKRLYETKKNTSQLKQLMAKYSPMLEVHLSDENRSHFSKILAKYGSAEYPSSSSEKRFRNVKSPKFETGEKSILPKVIGTFIVFLLLSGTVFIGLPLVREKLANNVPEEISLSKEQSDDEKTSETTKEPELSPTPEEASVIPPVETTTVAATNVTDPTASTNATSTPSEANNDAQKTEAQTDKVQNEYLLPSDTRLLTKEDIQNLSKKEVKLAINELFARKGYDFGGSGQYYDYFSQKSWYQPDSSIKSPVEAEAKFSEIERKNLQLLVKRRNNL